MAAIEHKPGQHATLYDAVAGRIGYEGFLSEQQPATNRDTTTTTESAVPPDEVLFRPNDAPARYAEEDIYEADRRLRSSGELPDSDLLKLVHTYAADFYSSPVNNGSQRDFRSMDETALLAIGFLLEEAAVQVLGRTGDLALVEPGPRDLPSTTEGANKHDARWKDRIVTHVKKA